MTETTQKPGVRMVIGGSMETRERFRALPDYLPSHDTEAMWNLEPLFRWEDSYEQAMANGLQLLRQDPEQHAFKVEKQTTRISTQTEVTG